MEPTALDSEQLRLLAREAGFPLAGVAAAGPADPQGRLAGWLDAGYAADMAWMGTRRMERADPRLFFPGARTVLALGVPYAPEEEDPPPLAGWGRVARFARGRDYHKVIGRRLRRLRRALEAALPGLACHAEVDTGPVLERHWAAQAGLGWFGAHAGIVVPGMGSWVLLAVLLLDRPASPPGKPLERGCRACARCLAGCPTRALVAPGMVDARRCIAYLTVEHRGPIPTELRGMLGSRLFGCDACQEVCPYDREVAAGDPELAALPGRRDLELARLLRLAGDAELDAWLAGSSLRRPRAAGLKRNAALVLGNQGDRAAVPLLAAALRNEPSAVVRGAAAWALGRLGGAAARGELAAARTREPDSGVRAEIAEALESTPCTQGTPDERSLPCPTGSGCC